MLSSKYFMAEHLSFPSITGPNALHNTCDKINRIIHTSHAAITFSVKNYSTRPLGQSAHSTRSLRPKTHRLITRLSQQVRCRGPVICAPKISGPETRTNTVFFTQTHLIIPELIVHFHFDTVLAVSPKCQTSAARSRTGRDVNPDAD